MVWTSVCSGVEISLLTSAKAGLGVCREVTFVFETGKSVSVGGADQGVGVVLDSLGVSAASFSCIPGGDVEMTLGGGVVIVGRVLTVFSAVETRAAEAVGSSEGTAGAGLDTLTVPVWDDVTVTVSTLAVEVKVVDAAIVEGLQTNAAAADVTATGATVAMVTGGVWTGLVGTLVAVTLVLSWAVEDGTELAEVDAKVVTGDTTEALTAVDGFVVGKVLRPVALGQAWAAFTSVTGAAVVRGDPETGFGEAETVWTEDVTCDRI